MDVDAANPEIPPADRRLGIRRRCERPRVSDRAPKVPPAQKTEDLRRAAAPVLRRAATSAEAGSCCARSRPCGNSHAGDIRQGQRPCGAISRGHLRMNAPAPGWPIGHLPPEGESYVGIANPESPTPNPRIPNPKSRIPNPDPESLIPVCVKLPRMLKHLISALIVMVALPVAGCARRRCRQDGQWLGRRRHGGQRHPRVSRDSVRRAAGGRAALEAAAAGQELGRASARRRSSARAACRRRSSAT